MVDFQGQLILITGGAGSIGQAVAEGFLEGGAGKVVLLDNRDDAIREVVEAMNRQYPGRVSGVREIGRAHV